MPSSGTYRWAGWCTINPVRTTMHTTQTNITLAQTKEEEREKTQRSQLNIHKKIETPSPQLNPPHLPPFLLFNMLLSRPIRVAYMYVCDLICYDQKLMNSINFLLPPTPLPNQPPRHTFSTHHILFIDQSRAKRERDRDRQRLSSYSVTQSLLRADTQRGECKGSVASIPPPPGGGRDRNE